MARPQGERSSRAGRAAGKVKIRATIAKRLQPSIRAKVDLKSEKFDLLVNFLQLFVQDKSSINRSTFTQLDRFVFVLCRKIPKLSQSVGGCDGGSSDRTREVKLLEQWVINFIIVSFDNFISDGLPSAIAIEKYP